MWTESSLTLRAEQNDKYESFALERKGRIAELFFEVGGKLLAVVSCSKYSAPCRKDVWPDVALVFSFSVEIDLMRP